LENPSEPLFLANMKVTPKTSNDRISKTFEGWPVFLCYFHGIGDTSRSYCLLGSSLDKILWCFVGNVMEKIGDSSKVSQAEGLAEGRKELKWEQHEERRW
jgi:hypothetical protein